MHSKVSSDWLPSYIKAMRPVLKIFKMAGYFPDSRHMGERFLPIVWWGHLRERSHLEDLDIDGKIMLQWILKRDED
jgi:hypothetical protein